MKTFEFGEWVLIDGVTSGQIISGKNGIWTVDVNGMWGEYAEDRVQSDSRYIKLSTTKSTT